MATIIDFPGTNDKESKSKKVNREERARTEARANRVARILLYAGLGVSALTLCVGTALHKTKDLYKKIRSKSQ